jgi:hypothetical protein
MGKRAPATVSADVEEAYLPTPFEQKAAAELLEKRRNTPTSRLRLKNESGGRFSCELEHSDHSVGTALLMNSLGSANPSFVDAMLSDLARLTVNADNEVENQKLEQLLSMAQGIRPKDEIEAMLAVQMALVHQATVTAASCLKHSNTLAGDAQHANAMNKLARTFATQVEALKKHRSTGEQSICVQHVNVTGQAIVGNVQTGGGGGVPTEAEHQPHELDATALPGIAYAPGASLFSNVEALRPALQSAGGERLECVPLPRSKGRSA